MKLKPTKFEMKIWTVADMDRPYTLNQLVYLGKLGSTPKRNKAR
jgi:hypothetical protein